MGNQGPDDVGATGAETGPTRLVPPASDSPVLRLPTARVEHFARYVAIVSALGGYSYLLGWIFFTVLLARFSVNPEQIGIDAAAATVRGGFAVATVALFTYLAFSILGVNRHLRNVAVGLSWRVNLAFLIGIPFTFALGCWGAFSVFAAAIEGWAWAKWLISIAINAALTLSLLSHVLVATRYGRKAPLLPSSVDLDKASSRSALAAVVLFGGLVLAVTTGIATIAGDRIETGHAVSFPGVRFPVVYLAEGFVDLGENEATESDAAPPECVIYFGSGDEVTIAYSLRWGVMRIPSGLTRAFDTGVGRC